MMKKSPRQRSLEDCIENAAGLLRSPYGIIPFSGRCPDDLLARLDHKFDSRPHLVVDGYVCELRHTGDVDAVVL